MIYNKSFSHQSQRENSKKIKLSLFTPIDVSVHTNVSKDEFELTSVYTLEEFNHCLENSEMLAVSVYQIGKGTEYLGMLTEKGVCCIVNFKFMDDISINILNEIFAYNKEVILQDGKEILNILQPKGINIVGNIFDIFIAAKLLDSGRGEIFNYNALLSKCSIGKPSNYLNWNHSISDNHVNDAANNLQAMIKLKKVLQKQLELLLLTKTSKLEFDCLYPVANLEQSGIRIDIEKYQRLIEGLRQRSNDLCSQLKDQLNISSLDEINEVIGALKIKGLSIQGLSKKELTKYSDDEEIKKYLEYKSLKNILSSYNEDFIKNIDVKTERVYPKYSQVNSATGRIYSNSPNIQQWPRKKEFRECIVAKEGYSLVIADYSQIELKIVAELSNDDILIQAFQNKQDIHTLTAATINNKDICEVSKEERRAAKVVNFGLIYGMSEQGLIEKCYEQYGITMSMNDAKAFFRRFFDKFNGIEKWQISANINFNNVARTVLGRRRVWSKRPSKSQIYNTPIQGTGADILKLALVKLHKALDKSNSKVVLVVHDEILIEAPVEEAEEVKEIVRDCMIKAGEEFIKKVPIEVEVSVGSSWAYK